MKSVPWWAVGVATAAPVMLIGGFSVGAAIQPSSYNTVRDTISGLAAQGASDSWVMTSALVGVGLCYLLAALGLQPAGSVGRVLLASGGVAALFIALFRQPQRGYSLPHELAVAVAVAALTCCTWPVFASHRRHPELLLTRVPSIASAGVALGLWRGTRSKAMAGMVPCGDSPSAARPQRLLCGCSSSLSRLGTHLLNVHRPPSCRSEKTLRERSDSSHLSFSTMMSGAFGLPSCRR